MTDTTTTGEIKSLTNSQVWGSLKLANYLLKRIVTLFGYLQLF